MLGILHWHFDPVLLSIGPLHIRWYGMLFAVAFLSGYWFIARVCREEGQTHLDLDSLLYYIMGGIILGARLAHCLIYDPAYYLSHPFDILKIWEGGLASHGGAVGGLLGLWLYSRHHALPSLLWLVDRITIPSMFGGALVRCANFLNSEIVGNPTDGTWGVVFESVDNLPRHPVQLYEAAAYLVIFLILLTVYRRYRAATPRGLLTGIFFACVFFARFVLEYFKTPQAAYESGFSISVGQWLSVPFMLAGLVLAAYALRSSNK